MTSEESEEKSSGSQDASEGETRKKSRLLSVTTIDGQDYIQTPVVKIPIGPWWCFVLTLILLPLFLYGLVFWLAGKTIEWFTRTDHTPAKDALWFMKVGRWLMHAFWMPNELYFRWKNPTAYEAWKASLKGASKAAGFAAKQALRTAGKIVNAADDAGKD